MIQKGIQKNQTKKKEHNWMYSRKKGKRKMNDLIQNQYMITSKLLIKIRADKEKRYDSEQLIN